MTPTVTLILSINDNGLGVYTPGDYALYATDNKALGNGGIASFEVNLGGVTTQNINNVAPGGHYETGSGASKGTYEVGFTIDPGSASVPTIRSKATGAGVNSNPKRVA